MSKYENIHILDKTTLESLVKKHETYAEILRHLGYKGKNVYAVKLLKRKLSNYNIPFKSERHKHVKSSVISTIDKQLLQIYYDTSFTKKEVLAKLGYSHGRYYQILLNKTTQLNIDLSKFENNTIKHKKEQVGYKLEDVLVKNSSYNKYSLKKRLLKKDLLKHKCYICGIGPEWNGIYLSLQLDHINGVNNDDRLCNLRILCPNCHSQTDTYARKNVKKKQNNL